LSLFNTAMTDEEICAVWKTLENNYYDHNKARAIINVRAVTTLTGVFYETIKDIPPGGELLKMNGFSTWITDIPDVLKDSNIGGFARFIEEYSTDIVGDPMEKEILIMRDTLRRLVKLA
jgi:hypothetical protein